MDLQSIIALNVLGLALAGALLPLIWRPPGHAAMSLVSTGVVIATGAGLLFMPRSAGTIGAVLFVPLIALPVLFGTLAGRHAMRGQSRKAATYARLYAVFHPTPRARFTAASLAAQAHDGIEEKAAALRELARTATPEQKIMLQTIELRQRGDWAGVVALLRDKPAAVREMPGMLIRALGEVGRQDDMLQTYEIARDGLSSSDLAACQMFVTAFCGRGAQVEALLEMPSLAILEPNSKAYWRAVAARNGGSAEAAWRQPLEALALQAPDATVRVAAARQLAQSAPLLPTLEPASKAILQRIEWQISARAAARRPMQKTPAAGPWGPTQPAASAPRRVRGRPVTYGLLAVLAVVYLIEEMRGGSQNLRSLVDLGALWPQYVLQRGEWWRLFTAMFLHFGPLHVGLNGLMLFLLGRVFETRFGSIRLLLVFLLGGIASTAFVLWTMWAGYSRPAVMVGASGAIFAVFGYEVAWQLVSWLRTRDASDARGLVSAGIALGIQVAIDMSIPEISFAAHASGLLAGAAMGLASALVWQRRASPATG